MSKDERLLDLQDVFHNICLVNELPEDTIGDLWELYWKFYQQELLHRWQKKIEWFLREKAGVLNAREPAK